MIGRRSDHFLLAISVVEAQTTVSLAKRSKRREANRNGCIHRLDFFSSETDGSAKSPLRSLKADDHFTTYATAIRVCRKWIPPLWSNSPVRDDITLCVSSDWLWAGCQVISASVLLVFIMGHTLFIGRYDNTNSLILGVLSCNSLRWFAYYHSLVIWVQFFLKPVIRVFHVFSFSRKKQPTRTYFLFCRNFKTL